MATTARPTITPPAIAPAVDDGLCPEEDDDVADDGPIVPVFTHEVDGHEVHDMVEREHVSSEAQTGQEGLVSGHWTHLRKSERKDDS